MADVNKGSNQNNEVSSTQPEVSGSNGESSAESSSSSSSILTPRPIKAPRFMLSPSLLGGSLAGGKSPSRAFVLNPARLSNPFATLKTDADGSAGDGKFSEASGGGEPSCKTPTKKPEEPKVSFVPLGVEPSTPTVQPSLSQPSTPSLTFVFGQNIHEKVEAASPAETASSTVSDPVGAAGSSTREGISAGAGATDVPSVPTQSESGQTPLNNSFLGAATSSATTNGATSEMLFSAQVKKEDNKSLDGGGKTLSEAAREYEEARAVKRKFEEVQVITGEEEESNVLQINCKLFSWSSCSWVERGRGTLRVNDLPTNPTQHRLIVRTAGSLRVVLNTKIWSGMTVDRASTKSMRITAMDSNGVVKVFLLMASPKEMDQLQKCLVWRVNNMKKLEDGGGGGGGCSGSKKPKDDDSTTATAPSS